MCCRSSDTSMAVNRRVSESRNRSMNAPTMFLWSFASATTEGGRIHCAGILATSASRFLAAISCHDTVALDIIGATEGGSVVCRPAQWSRGAKKGAKPQWNIIHREWEVLAAEGSFDEGGPKRYTLSQASKAFVSHVFTRSAATVHPGILSFRRTYLRAARGRNRSDSVHALMRK